MIAASALPSFERLVSRLVPDRLERTGCDLVSVRRRLGIVDVLYEPRRTHGETVWGRRGPVLLIQTSHSLGRRNMTLAHELGHAIFDPLFAPNMLSVPDQQTRCERIEFSTRLLGNDMDQFRDAVESAGLEKVCDEFAFELLFPARWVPGEAVTADGLATFERMAERYGVSLTLAVVRVNTACRGSARSLLQFRLDHRRNWLVVDAICPPPGWTEGAYLSDATSAALSPLRRDSAPRRMMLSTTRSSTPPITADVKRGSESAVALSLPHDQDLASNLFQPRSYIVDR